MAVIMRNGINIVTAVHMDKLYELELLTEKCVFAGATEKQNDTEVWHHISHLNNLDIEKLVRNEMIIDLPKVNTNSKRNSLTCRCAHNFLID
jgi:hypothetical protein